MKTILDEAVSHLGRASYAALSAWLQGVPADRIASRWRVSTPAMGTSSCSQLVD